MKMKLAIALFCYLCFQLAHSTNTRDGSHSEIKTQRKFQRKLIFFTEEDINNLISTGQQVARTYNTRDAPSTQAEPAPVKPTAPPQQTTPVESNAGCRSVMEVIGSLTHLTTFTSLIKTVQLDREFNKQFIGTVFAPTNAAFEQLAAQRGISVQQLIHPSQKNLIETMLALHVVPTLALDVEEFQNSQELPTFLAGPETLTMWKQSHWSVSSKRPVTGFLLQSNLFSCYGVVHVINNVLMPTQATLP